LTEAASDLGVYVHWPYCARICPYCDFNVVRDRGQGQAELGGAILADLERQARRLGRRRLSSIFFGGGTPSLMDPKLVGEIVSRACELFEAAPDLEVTLEANPTDAEADRFFAFAEAGVNRLSLGVQSLDDAALAFLGRNHDAAAAIRAARIASRAFARLSIDLIYALPGQTASAWREDLARALALQPEHVSAYQLTIEDKTAFARAVAHGRWTPAASDLAADLFETTGVVLEGAGFHAYEVSNHARSEAARSRHNLIYWRGGDYLGLGPGAHGRLTAADGRRFATSAAPKIADYLAQVRTAARGAAPCEALSPSEAALERLLMGLRTIEGVELSALTPLGLDPALIGRLAAQGLLRQGAGRLAATPAGVKVLDRLTSELAFSASAKA
jgi:oxygen-independent coproporphyrinogen-3 oxidase